MREIGMADGTLSWERYELYCGLHKENVKNHAKKKEISKWVKQMRKQDKYRYKQEVTSLLLYKTTV